MIGPNFSGHLQHNFKGEVVSAQEHQRESVSGFDVLGFSKVCMRREHLHPRPKLSEPSTVSHRPDS